MSHRKRALLLETGGRSPRDEFQMDPALFPHAPIFIRKANTVVLWSTKSACSHVVLWTFLHDGLFEEAAAYGPWPHDYREKVYRQGPAFTELH